MYGLILILLLARREEYLSTKTSLRYCFVCGIAPHNILFLLKQFAVIPLSVCGIAPHNILLLLKQFSVIALSICVRLYLFNNGCQISTYPFMFVVKLLMDMLF